MWHTNVERRIIYTAMQSMSHYSDGDDDDYDMMMIYYLHHFCQGFLRSLFM